MTLTKPCFPIPQSCFFSHLPIFPTSFFSAFRIPNSTFRPPHLPVSLSPPLRLSPSLFYSPISPSFHSAFRIPNSAFQTSPHLPVPAFLYSRQIVSAPRNPESGIWHPLILRLPLTHPPFLRVSPPKIPLFSTLLGFFSATALTYGEQNRVDSHIVQPGANSTRSHAESFSKNGFFFSNK